MSSIVSKIEALVTANDLPQRVSGALKGWWRPAPDPALQRERYIARRRLSPEMSYGRHGGPAPSTARSAAVTVILFLRDPPTGGAPRWHLPLIERPRTLSRHAGQISLPGGAVDVGESSLEAAQRESYEELGFHATHLEVGQLADCYVFASDFLITPWIIASFEPVTHWQPHDREVQGVVELPLEVLLDDSSIGSMTIERGPLVFHAPCIRLGGACIWGATAVILSELAAVLRQSNY